MTIYLYDFWYDSGIWDVRTCKDIYEFWPETLETETWNVEKTWKVAQLEKSENCVFIFLR